MYRSDYYNDRDVQDKKGKNMMNTKCLSPMEMIDYLSNQMAPSERYLMEDHLSRCDDCLTKLTVSYDVIHSPEMAQWKLLEPAKKVKRKEKLFQHQVLAIKQTVKKIYRWTKKQKQTKKQLYLWDIRLQPPAWTLQSALLSPVRVRKNHDKQSGFVEMNTKLKGANVKIYVEKNDDHSVIVKVGVYQIKNINRHPRIILKKDGMSGIWARTQSRQYVLFENIPFGMYQLSIDQEYQSLENFAFRIDAKGVQTDD